MKTREDFTQHIKKIGQTIMDRADSISADPSITSSIEINIEIHPTATTLRWVTKSLPIGNGGSAKVGEIQVGREQEC